MPDVGRRLAGPVALTTTATTRYTTPAATTAHVTCIQVTNTTGAPIAFTLSIGVDAAGTRLFGAVLVGANDVLSWTGLHVLAATEILQAYAAATGLTLTVSGIEST